MIDSIYYDKDFEMNYLEFAYRSILPKKIVSISNLQKIYHLINANNNEEVMDKSLLLNFLEPHF